MDRAQAFFPHLTLDPKRIAGTSFAICLHVAVLMLLMLPAQTAPPKSLLEDPPLIVVPTHLEKKPEPPPPTPITRPHGQPDHQTHLTPPLVESVDQTPTAVDIYVPPTTQIEIPDNFKPEPQSVFEQIKADIAPPPPYPAQALHRHITGEVMLRVRVDTQGRPVSAEIERSSGSRLLDDAALKFVLARWHFIPAVRDGGPVEGDALVPINFVIEN
jgi:protein TonB